MCVVLSRAEINCTLWWILLRFAVHCFELCWDWLCAVCQGPCWDWICAVRNRAEIDCVLSWTVIYQLKLQISLCISNNLGQHLLNNCFSFSQSWGIKSFKRRGEKFRFILRERRQSCWKNRDDQHSTEPDRLQQGAVRTACRRPKSGTIVAGVYLIDCLIRKNPMPSNSYHLVINYESYRGSFLVVWMGGMSGWVIVLKYNIYSHSFVLSMKI